MRMSEHARLAGRQDREEEEGLASRISLGGVRTKAPSVQSLSPEANVGVLERGALEIGSGECA